MEAIKPIEIDAEVYDLWNEQSGPEGISLKERLEILEVFGMHGREVPSPGPTKNSIKDGTYKTLIFDKVQKFQQQAMDVLWVTTRLWSDIKLGADKDQIEAGMARLFFIVQDNVRFLSKFNRELLVKTFGVNILTDLELMLC